MKGLVRWEATIEQVNMDQGEWLVLARTNYLLEELMSIVETKAGFFEVKGRPSISEAKVRAVIYWERLRKGQTVTLAECANILKYIKVKTPKKLDLLDTDLVLQYEDLKSHFQTCPMVIGTMFLHLLSPKDISYIRAMLRRGEKITKQPRIRLSTIHAAKGGEATLTLYYLLI